MRAEGVMLGKQKKRFFPRCRRPARSAAKRKSVALGTVQESTVSPVGDDTKLFSLFKSNAKKVDEAAKTSIEPVPPGTTDSSPVRFRGALSNEVGLGLSPD